MHTHIEETHPLTTRRLSGLPSVANRTEGVQEDKPQMKRCFGVYLAVTEVQNSEM